MISPQSLLGKFPNHLAGNLVFENDFAGVHTGDSTQPAPARTTAPWGNRRDLDDIFAALEKSNLVVMDCAAFRRTRLGRLVTNTVQFL